MININLWRSRSDTNTHCDVIHTEIHFLFGIFFSFDARSKEIALSLFLSVYSCCVSCASFLKFQFNFVYAIKFPIHYHINSMRRKIIIISHFIIIMMCV